VLKAKIGGADANGTAEPADLDTAVPDHSADLSLADLARFRRLSYSKKTGAVRRGSKPIFGSCARRPANGIAAVPRVKFGACRSSESGGVRPISGHPSAALIAIGPLIGVGDCSLGLQ
jgi:hypothetical protein